MPSRSTADLYRLAVAATGLGALALTARQLPPPGPAWLVALGFLVAGIAALLFPLRLSLTNRVTVASSVFFAGLLVLPPRLAVLSAALAMFAKSVISVAQRIRHHRPRPPLSVIGLALCFNPGLTAASLWVPSLVFPDAQVLAAHRGWGITVLSAVAAGILMYLLNLTLNAIAVALRTGTRPLQTIAIAMRPVRMEFAALYAVGLGAAVAIAIAPWAVVTLVPATIALHSLLERAVRLRSETVAAVERMAGLVDRRDPYTADHSRRVAGYAVLIARQLGMSGQDVEQLRLAAMVHDIGKIEIPDAILLKDGRLTAAEKALMDTHPRVGYELLHQFSEYAHVRELVLTHHERYDGRGYPSGIRTSALPLIAQVIPVADSVDAMTTARPYRGPLSWPAALDELASGRGTQWNPTVVDAALRVFASRREQPAPALAIA